jgi:hypothetical protein
VKTLIKGIKNSCESCLLSDVLYAINPPTRNEINIRNENCTRRANDEWIYDTKDSP